LTVQVKGAVTKFAAERSPETTPPLRYSTTRMTETVAPIVHVRRLVRSVATD